MSALPNPARHAHGLLFQLKTKVLGCFGDTTAHGYGRVATSESQHLRRWFWLFVCTAAFTTFTQQLYVITQQYMSRPLKTRNSIGHEEKLVFPQITICNLNMIRRSQIPKDIVAKFPEVLGGRSNIKRNATAKQQSATSSVGSSGRKAVPNNDDLPDEEKLIQEVLEELAEIPEEKLVNYGHQLDEMVLSCHFNRMECLNQDMRKYWTQFWNRHYGNCFTFNKGMDANGSHTDVMNASHPGRGLTLEINIQQDEYVSSLAQEAGVRVFVGVQNDMPFPFEQGMSVSPGFATGIELRKVIIGRLDPFHNRSCESRTDRLYDTVFARYNVTYTTMACKVSCVAKMMNSSCGCVMFELKYDDKSVCRGDNESVVECVNDVFEKVDNGACNTICRERCREDVFKTTTSLAKWPSHEYKSTLNAEIQDKGVFNHSGEISDHFLKLKVYYGELNFEVVEEEDAYTIASFLSDIGGLMGMWIGISVLTIVELLELIATLLITTFKTLSKRRADRVVDIKQIQNSE